MNALIMTEDKLHTVREVAEFLRISPKTVRKMIAEGQLEAILVRDEYRIWKSEVDRFLHKKDEDQGE